MPQRGALGVHAERCSAEPWPGSALHTTGADAGAVATRALGREGLRSLSTPSPPSATMCDAVRTPRSCRATPRPDGSQDVPRELRPSSPAAHPCLPYGTQ
jgi:hypothetical protein